MNVEIYHNPRCRKSREALSYLEEAGHDITIIEYLKDSPSRADFLKVLAKLNLGPQALLRKGETLFKEKFKGMNFNDDEWIDIMLEHPKLIERPIVIRGNKAVIGRPLDNVVELLG